MRRVLAALVLVLLVPAASAQGGAEARVELAAEAGAWNGLSCTSADSVEGGVPVWVPPGARVHAVTLDQPNASVPAGWRAAGREAVRVDAPEGRATACVSFDFPESRPVLVRFVAPLDLARATFSVTPPEGFVARSEGLAFEPDAVGGPYAAGETVRIGVVEAGRIGELSLLASIGGLSLVALAGGLAWHALRPPLGGRPAERFLDHLGELQARLLPPAIAFALLNLVYFTTGLRVVEINGVPLVAPTFGTDGSVASRAFDAFAERLVPNGVTLVALRPVDAVLAQVQTALFLALLTVAPLLLWETAAFLGPGLEPRERRALLTSLPILAALLLGGALFGYLVMAPLMIDTLYGYAPGLGALPLLGVGDLVGFALLVILAFALAFELPVAMYALSRLGLVKATTFGRYLRHALLVIVILAGVVTPDPSVVTQLLVAGPVFLLYLVGIGAAWFGGRRRAARAG